MKYMFFWLFVIIGVLFIWFTIRSILDLKSKEAIVTDTQKEYEEVVNENEKLKKQLEEIRSQGYIEKQARNKLNLGRSGEQIVIAPSVSPTPSPSPTPILTLLEKIKKFITF